MAISFSEKIAPISQKQFHEIDYAVMAMAFDVQRDLGSAYLNEHIYQSELAHRCLSFGFESVRIEEPITGSFDSFRTTYAVDLLINNGALFELKTATGICAEHLSQTLNYLLLTGLHHGKVLNFSPRRVERQFVSTTITKESRLLYDINTDDWRAVDRDSAWLQEIVETIVADWGVFLDVGLYIDAIVHFRGGTENVVQPIPLSYRSRMLGCQKLHLLNENTAFKLTAFTREVAKRRRGLQQFLALTPLQQIQWVNSNHHQVTFRTICRDSK